MLNKQKFKGVTLYRKRVVDNILRTYRDDRLNIDTDWYRKANAFAIGLAEEYGHDTVTVAGIIASLSPLKSWQENKRIARVFLETGNSLHTRKLEAKAIEIRDYEGNDRVGHCLEVLNGNKIKAFFLNIAFPEKQGIVTVDRHAISIALGRNIREAEGIGITDGQYAFFVSCYRQAAQMEGVRDSLMQSVSWEKHRIIKNKFTKL